MAKKYSEEEKETALILVASGHTYKAAGAQLGINEATIRTWVRNEPERWAEIRTQEAPKWRAQAAIRAEDLADRSHKLAVDALEQAEKDLEAGRLEPKDYLNLLKTATLGMGISIDKANVLRDRPTEVVEHRYDLAQIEKAIRATEQVIEGTATEIVEALPETTESAP